MSPLPAELLELTKAQLQVLADDLAQLLADTEPFYRAVRDSAPDVLRTVCEVNLRQVFDAQIERREVDLNAVRKTARAQATQGIPLSAALRAFRIAGTYIYETMVEAMPPGSLSSEQLLQVSGNVWRVIDFLSTAIAATYAEVESTATEQLDQARMATMDALLGGRLTQAQAEDAARGLDLPRGGLFVVVFSDRPMLEAGHRVSVSMLLDHRRWRVLWRPDNGCETGIVVLDRETGLRTLRHELAGASFGVGLSPVVHGIDALPAALRKARIARRSLPPDAEGVAVFGDEPVTTLVAGAMALAREVAADLLAGVFALPAAERQVLLTTLQVWYAEDGSAQNTGRKLFVHPNTVRYRIRRLQELTGRDLTKPKAIAELFVAIEVARLDPGLADRGR